MRKMKDSGIEWIGEIPEDWEVMKIKNLVSEKNSLFMDGDWIESNVIQNSGIRYLTTGNIGSGYFKEQGNGYISEYTFENLQCTKVLPNDLVISRLNEPVGRACIIPDKFSEYVIAVDNVVLRPDEKYYKRFIMYCMNVKLYNDMAKLMSRGTTMLRISRSILGTFNLPIPSYDEEKIIADYLDEKVQKIDNIISKTQETIEEYKKYKQSVIVEAVTKGLNPNVEMKDSGIEWIGEIPKHWKIKKISRVYKERIEKVSDKDYSPLSVTKKGVVPQLENAAKTTNGDNRKLVKKGDFAINSRSDRRGSCGISPLDGSVSLIMTVLKPCNNIINKYYNYVFRSERFSDEFYKWGHGIVDDLWSTKWEDMKRIIIPFPDKEEQELIADYLNNKVNKIDNIISKKQELIVQLEEYKKSLIYECVTGKKEVALAYAD